MAWLSWDKMMLPKASGGIKFGDMRAFKSNSSRPRIPPTRKTRLQFAQNSFCGPARAGTDADPPNGSVKRHIRGKCYFTGRLCGVCSLRCCTRISSARKIKSNISTAPLPEKVPNAPTPLCENCSRLRGKLYTPRISFYTGPFGGSSSAVVRAVLQIRFSANCKRVLRVGVMRGLL